MDYFFIATIIIIKALRRLVKGKETPAAVANTYDIDLSRMAKKSTNNHTYKIGD